MTSEVDDDSGLPAKAARVHSGRDIGLLVLLSAVAALLLGQLLVGTSAYFALCVGASLVIVVLTLQRIGYSSIAGVFIAYMAFRYLVFSQIIKTLYGQSGDSNLADPNTTVTVLLIGTMSICLAAVIVAQILGRRQLLLIDPSPEVLVYVRNLSFVVGFVIFAVVLRMGEAETGDAEVGGIVGVARQFLNIAYLSILAETWRILKSSNGQRSISWILCVMLAVLLFIGILTNSKKAIADPLLMYLIASIAYRRYITRTQTFIALGALVVGILIVYPAVQIMRGERGVGGLSIDAVSEFVYRTVVDPAALREEWQAYQVEPDISVMAQGLYYLGDFDDLMNRFMLISNTDVVVNAVDESGPFGTGLISDGFALLLPTFIYPDKPRVGPGDQLTWYYGLRVWGLQGSPTIGLFADCYAALQWTGIIIIPFLIMILYFPEVQLSGTRIAGNILGVYFLFRNLHSFGEGGIADFIVAIGRGNTLDLALILGLLYLSEILVVRRKPHALAHGSTGGIDQSQKPATLAGRSYAQSPEESS